MARGTYSRARARKAFLTCLPLRPSASKHISPSLRSARDTKRFLRTLTTWPEVSDVWPYTQWPITWRNVTHLALFWTIPPIWIAFIEHVLHSTWKILASDYIVIRRSQSLLEVFYVFIVCFCWYKKRLLFFFFLLIWSRNYKNN